MHLFLRSNIPWTNSLSCNSRSWYSGSGPGRLLSRPPRRFSVLRSVIYLFLTQGSCPVREFLHDVLELVLRYHLLGFDPVVQFLAKFCLADTGNAVFSSLIIASILAVWPASIFNLSVRRNSDIPSNAAPSTLWLLKLYMYCIVLSPKTAECCSM